MVRCCSGTPLEKSNLGKACGRMVWVTSKLTSETAKAEVPVKPIIANSHTSQLLSPLLFATNTMIAVNNIVSIKILPSYNIRRKGLQHRLKLETNGLRQLSFCLSKVRPSSVK